MQNGRRRTTPRTSILRLSYFRRIFLYFTALVSAVVIASAVVSYLVARAQILRDVNERSERDLERIAASFSSIVASSIIPAAVQVYESFPVQKLIYGSALTDRERLDATQLLDRFKLANPLIDSIVVYNHQSSFFYSTKWGPRPAADPAMSGLGALLSDVSVFPLYRIIPRVAEGTRLFTVIVGYPPSTEKNLLGALILNVNEPAVRSQIIGGIESHGGALSILDGSGLILSASDPALFGARASTGGALAQAMAARQLQGFFDNPKERERVSYYRDPAGEWFYVSAIPDAVLFAEIALRRNQLVLVFGALFALALLLALTTTRSAAIPVERLIGQARALHEEFLDMDHRGPAGDEVALVSETMRQLDEQLRGVRLAIESGAAYRERRALGRLIRGEALAPEEVDALKAKIAVDDTSPAVIVLASPEPGGFGAKGDAVPAGLRAGEEAPPDFSAFTAELEKAVPTVLACAELAREGVAAVVSAGGQCALIPALERLLAETSGSWTIGMSDAVDEWDALPDAFESARQALHYRFRFGKGAVIPASKCIAERPYTIPDERLRRFAEHARLLESEETLRAAGELLQEVRAYTYEDFIFLTQHLLYALERLLLESRSGAHNDLADLRSCRMNTRWADTPEHVLRVIEKFYGMYAEHGRFQAGDRTVNLVSEIKRIVSENIGDPNLGAKLIAERVMLSVNYVRGTFKTATGGSLSTYIADLRIEKCVALLRSTQKSVKDVCAEAGFANYTYFFTLFKKRTGHTPQDYQRANQSS